MPGHCNALNGSYVMGYSDMNRKPFDSIFLIPDTYPDIERIVLNDSRLSAIAERTKSFLDGFYSDFGLELLSSVDYIMSSYGKDSTNEQIYSHIIEWNQRKAKIIEDIRYINIAREKILANKFLNPELGGSRRDCGNCDATTSQGDSHCGCVPY